MFTSFGQYKQSRYICQELKNDMIMAKQRGPVFIEGTIDGRTYYKLNGKYYVRKKSSLSARRVKRTPAFRRTMAYAGWMAGASVIASAIYWRLPEKEKKRKRYQALTGEAMRLLRDGVDEATVRAKLEAAHLRKEVVGQAGLKPVEVEADTRQVACGGDTEKVVSTAVKQQSHNQVKGQSIAIIPSPAARVRRPRVLRYKAKPHYAILPQKSLKSAGGPPVAVPA